MFTKIQTLIPHIIEKAQQDELLFDVEECEMFTGKYEMITNHKILIEKIKRFVRVSRRKNKI